MMTSTGFQEVCADILKIYSSVLCAFWSFYRPLSVAIATSLSPASPKTLFAAEKQFVSSLYNLLRFTFESQPSCHFLSIPVSSTQFIAVLSDVETFLKEVQQLDLKSISCPARYWCVFSHASFTGVHIWTWLAPERLRVYVPNMSLSFFRCIVSMTACNSRIFTTAVPNKSKLFR